MQFSEDPQAVAIIDETNKCYTYLTERDTEEVTCSFFFKNKKLIKLILDGHYSGQTTGYSKMTFDYQPIEPERPDSYNFDSHIEYSHDGIPVIASENNDRIIIDTSAEY
ncbi:MAG: hypothetical protein MJ233_05270 [Mycoplasmoidaceae bacterium]|nr:hypothetical protein [Mycoplasmoidaceae bacterium]